MATLGNLENKPVLVSEMRDYVGAISAHARGGNTLKATKTGAMVSVDDAYAGRLLKLTAYGNSVQDGTPTPESPVEIKSVAGVKACTSGKNLANFTPKSERGITCVKNDDGTVTISGTPTGDWAGFGNSINCDLPELGPYTISITKALPYKVGCTVTLDDGTTQRPSISVGSTSTSFTVSKPVKWIAFTLTSLTAGTALSAETFGFQLEKGSTATTFEPGSLMITPLTLVDSEGVAHELCNTGNYRDRLELNADGSGTLYKTLCEYDMTGDDLTVDISTSIPLYAGMYTNCYGSSSAFLNSVVYRTHGLANNAFHIVANKSGEVFVKATSFVGRMYYDVANEQDNVACAAIINGGKQLAFRMDKTAFPTLASAQAYFNEHPQRVIFKMAQEVPYHIPAINMPALPDLVSNCWLSATDASGAAIPCEVGIEYRRDINKVIEDIETAIADIVSA